MAKALNKVRRFALYLNFPFRQKMELGGGLFRAKMRFGMWIFSSKDCNWMRNFLQIRIWDEDPFFKRKGPPPNPLSKRTTRVRWVRTAHRGAVASINALRSPNCKHSDATYFYEVSFFSLRKKRTSLVHPQEKKRIARLCSKSCAIAGCPTLSMPTKAKLAFPFVNPICSHDTSEI